jgi:hypothetical protein
LPQKASSGKMFGQASKYALNKNESSQAGEMKNKISFLKV